MRGGTVTRWTAVRITAITAVVVASLGGLVLIDRSLDRAESARLSERQRTVEALADAVDQMVDASIQRLDTVAAAVEPWTGEPDAGELERTERLLSSEDPLGGTLVLVDTEGIVRIASADATPLLGQQLDSDAIDRALAGSPAVSGLVREAEGGRHLHVAVPVGDRAGQVSAVLVSRVDPTTGALAELLDGPLAGPSGLAVVTGSGAIVAGDGEVRLVSGDDPNTRLPIEAEGPGVVRAYRGEADVIMTAAHAPVRADWRLVAFEPYDASRSALRTPFWIAAGVLVIVALLAIGGFTLGEVRARRAERGAESTKRSLLAVAGHELRTPLTVVRGLGQTLIERWDDLPEDNRREMLRTVERQSRVLDHLVERLLYAAQLETDSTTMVTSRPVDVARVVQRAAEDHRALAPAHEIRTDIDVPLTALADPKALDQVMFHLLDNAVRYSPSGGEVILAARQGGRQVEIVVEDEGVGLPADVDRIFDRFVQGEAVTTRTVDEGGVGLGLHIVRTLVELMDGSVRAEPREPRGARFVVTLPVA